MATGDSILILSPTAIKGARNLGEGSALPSAQRCELSTRPAIEGIPLPPDSRVSVVDFLGVVTRYWLQRPRGACPTARASVGSQTLESKGEATLTKEREVLSLRVSDQKLVGPACYSLPFLQNFLPYVGPQLRFCMESHSTTDTFEKDRGWEGGG